LYKERGEEGDTERAAVAAQIAILACERSRARNAQDEWINPTLLGLAFDAADVAAAKRYVKEVRREGPAAWKLDTTIADLERSVGQVEDAAKRQDLQGLLGELRQLV
jgi:citrate lyase beta subunit